MNFPRRHTILDGPRFSPRLLKSESLPFDEAAPGGGQSPPASGLFASRAAPFGRAPRAAGRRGPRSSPGCFRGKSLPVDPIPGPGPVEPGSRDVEDAVTNDGSGPRLEGSIDEKARGRARRSTTRGRGHGNRAQEARLPDLSPPRGGHRHGPDRPHLRRARRRSGCTVTTGPPISPNTPPGTSVTAATIRAARATPTSRRLHDKGAHLAVPCEDCHDALAAHIKDGKKIAEMPRVKSVTRLCGRCHRDLVARRDDFPDGSTSRSTSRTRARRLSDQVCFDCHNPHNPTP